MTSAAQRVELSLFSGFELRDRGSVLELRPASQRLVAYLALAGRVMERAATAFRLWPDVDEPHALANLRSSLWRVRQTPVPLVESTAGHMRLHPDVWVDARHGVAAFVDPDPDTVLNHADDATVAGELLPDWYDDWLVVERERLRQLRLHALERAALALIQRGRACEAIDVGLRALAMEPLRESAHRVVIAGHLSEGNVGEAQRQFEVCRQLLAEHLGVAPSSTLVAMLPAR